MNKLFLSLSLIFALVLAPTAQAFKVGGMNWVTMDGTVNQVMKTDGNANLGWLTVLSPGALSATTPLSYNSGTGNFSITLAGSTGAGYISSGDWINFNNRIIGLTGDVTATGPTGSTGPSNVAATVATVGGQTAANVAAGSVLANAAASANTANAIVRRDGSGNFTAGTVTANLTGNASGSAGSFTGNLTGDVTSTGMATTITGLARSKLAVGTGYAILANNSSGVMSENATLTASRAITSDTNGQLASIATTATELGYVNGVTSAIQTQFTSKAPSASPNFTGTVNMAGLTASQAVVTDASKNLTSLAYGSTNTNSTLVQRDGSGNFTAGTVTANLTGNVTGNASGSAASITGNLTGDVTSVGMATSITGLSLSKLATTTASRALVSSAGGVITPSTTTDTQIGYLSTTTSDVQTQLGTKAPTASPTFSGTVTFSGGTASTVPYLDASRLLTSSAATPTQLGYLANSTSNLCGISQSCTLTSKTLTAPVISTISNTGTLTLPTSTDTLVGRDTTDTLTNKTLTSPVISNGTGSGTFAGANATLSGTLAVTGASTGLSFAATKAVTDAALTPSLAATNTQTLTTATASGSSTINSTTVRNLGFAGSSSGNAYSYALKRVTSVAGVSGGDFGYNGTVQTLISSGVTDGGGIRGMNITARRNNTAAEADSGTLGDIHGARITYGHAATGTGTPTTTDVYGLYLAPQNSAGVITNHYALRIDGMSGTAPATLNYAIYQAGATAKNFFAGGILGTTTNDNAVTGNVGEFVTASPGGSVTPASSGSYKTVTSISLTAGDWDVSGTIGTTFGATTAGTQIGCIISLTTDALDVANANNYNTQFYTLAANNYDYRPCGPRRVSIASTTTVYLVGQMTYSILGGAVYGTNSSIQARRIR